MIVRAYVKTLLALTNRNFFSNIIMGKGNVVFWLMDK